MHQPGTAEAHWCTDNVGEAAPGVLTPLGATVWGIVGDAAPREVAYRIGVFNRAERVPATNAAERVATRDSAAPLRGNSRAGYGAKTPRRCSGSWLSTERGLTPRTRGCSRFSRTHNQSVEGGFAMAHVIEPGETDLIIPLPEPGEEVHPYTVHTHYFGFTIPEAGIGAYVYARYMPAFGISQGGPTIFRGMDNVSLLDAEYHDYRATMPWPEIDGHRIRFQSGYQIDFLEPGVLARLSYESPDGAVSFELEQRAVTPLLRRGHIVPGEEAHQGDPRRRHGGTEQFMHCTGVLCLYDEKFDVDCYAVRDRSWNQVRTEDPGGAQKSPPIGWSPAYFG
ncbi:MAG: hypothetical protein ACYDHH_32800, partial [Solirubrobacteraceae bacterium]